MNIFELPVHPDAAAFRMIPHEEMQKLAESIKSRGLNHPLVTTTLITFDEDTGDQIDTIVLVDGRNRREACRIAGVEPDVVDLNGKDVRLFIEDENDRRRHDTKGMQAMSYAIRFPEKSKGGRGNRNSEVSSEFTGRYLSQARTVLEQCDEETIEAAKVGAISLPKAYEKAQEIINAGEPEPTQAERLVVMQTRYPELASAVEDTEQALEIDGAEAQANQMDEEKEINRKALAGSLNRLFALPSYLSEPEGHAVLADLLIDNHDTFLQITDGKSYADFTEALDVIAKNVSSFKKAMKEYSDANNDNK